MGGAFGLVDYAGQRRVFNIACQRLLKVFFVLDARNKLIIRSYLQFAMIGRTCSGFHRGHVFIVESGFLLCIHIYIYIYIYISWCHMLYMPACREDRLILLYISILFFHIFLRKPCVRRTIVVNGVSYDVCGGMFDIQIS